MTDLSQVDDLFAAGSAVRLDWSSPDDRVNSLLEGSVRVFEHFFPSRIWGYYLIGSHVDGSAVSTSDIDLHPVFRGSFHSTEEDLVYRVRDRCNQIPVIDLNVDPWPDEVAGRFYSGLFSLVSVPIYGVDIRSSVPPPSREMFAKSAIGVGGLLKVRGVRRLQWPASFPDEDDEFFGYAGRPCYSFDGKSSEGTKDLVNVAYTIVRGRLAAIEDEYITSKAGAFERFREAIDDPSSDLISEIWARCREEWEYRVPTDSAGRRALREMSSRLLHVENAYLQVYRSFAVAQLGITLNDWPYGDVDYPAFSLRRLATVIYPGDLEILESVARFGESDNPLWRSEARQVIEAYEAVTC